MSTPFLIAGLGNPGTEYQGTPHNIGFEVIDALARHWRCADFQKKFQGLVTDAHQTSGKVFLLKPQTYMNLSGNSVRETVKFYKLDPTTQFLVVLDDLDLPPGQLRLRKSGGTGGHNGLRSVKENLGTEKFARLRIGIGKAASGPGGSHVLSKIPKAKKATYDEAVSRAIEGVEAILKDGIDKAMNFVNAREKQDGA